MDVTIAFCCLCFPFQTTLLFEQNSILRCTKKLEFKEVTYHLTHTWNVRKGCHAYSVREEDLSQESEIILSVLFSSILQKMTVIQPKGCFKDFDVFIFAYIFETIPVLWTLFLPPKNTNEVPPSVPVKKVIIGSPLLRSLRQCWRYHFSPTWSATMLYLGPSTFSVRCGWNKHGWWLMWNTRTEFVDFCNGYSDAPWDWNIYHYLPTFIYHTCSIWLKIRKHRHTHTKTDFGKLGKLV